MVTAAGDASMHERDEVGLVHVHLQLSDEEVNDETDVILDAQDTTTDREQLERDGLAHLLLQQPRGLQQLLVLKGQACKKVKVGVGEHPTEGTAGLILLCHPRFQIGRDLLLVVFQAPVDHLHQ